MTGGTGMKLNNNENIEFTYVRGYMNGFMFDIDGAVSIGDIEAIEIRGKELFRIDRNDEYKRCFVPTSGAGTATEMNWCSKDGETWDVCIDAFIGDETIDLHALKELLKAYDTAD
jgi:hypothetical protein